MVGLRVARLHNGKVQFVLTGFTALSFTSVTRVGQVVLPQFEIPPDLEACLDGQLPPRFRMVVVYLDARHHPFHCSEEQRYAIKLTVASFKQI